MKIYVTEVPTEAKKSLFARREITAYIPVSDYGREQIPIYEYYCNINNKPCNVDRGGKCNKLIVLKQEK